MNATLILLYLLAYILQVYSISDRERAESFHKKALDLVLHEHYEQGLAHFRAACRWNNHSALYWNDLGVTELRMGQYDRARKRFLKALSIDSSFELALQNMAELDYFSPSIVAVVESHKSHKISAPLEISHQQLSRVSVELLSPDSATDTTFVESLLSKPFIVKDAFPLVGLTESKLENIFNRKFLTTKYGSQRVDFYPHNMLDEKAHPYFLSMGNALRQLLYKPEEVYIGVDASEPGTYIQWNLDKELWDEIVVDLLGVTLPGMFNDTTWTQHCFDIPTSTSPEVTVTGDGRTSPILPSAISTGSSGASKTLSQFLLSTHWQMLLIGESGAGMFNHQDTLRTASWQLQLVGAKKWHLCGPEMSTFMYQAGEVDMFQVDFTKYPLVLNASCFEVTLQAGDLLYYPSDYWHQTVNLDTPSIALSSTLVTPYNYEQVIAELGTECTDNGLQRIFAYEETMCTAVNKCFEYWENKYSEFKLRNTMP